LATSHTAWAGSSHSPVNARSWKKGAKGADLFFALVLNMERATIERNDSRLPGTGVCGWIQGVDAAKHRRHFAIERAFV